MASVIDLCNMALGHLGDDASVSAISPPDGSIQAAHCSQFYPIARDITLERHSWRCSTRRTNLALSAEDPPIGWAYAYALPSECVAVRSIISPTALPDLFSTNYNQRSAAITNTDTLNSQDYIIETAANGSLILYTNVENAICKYSIGVTDVTKFSALMQFAISRLLASYLAGPLIKGTTGANVAKAQLEMFEKVDLPAAKESDAAQMQSNPYADSMPSAIAARA